MYYKLWCSFFFVWHRFLFDIHVSAVLCLMSLVFIVLDLLLLAILMLIGDYNSIEPRNFKLWFSAVARCNIGSCIGPIVIYCYSLSSTEVTVTKIRLNVIHKLPEVCQVPLYPASLFCPKNPGRLTGTQSTISVRCLVPDFWWISSFLPLNIGRFFLPI
jgi:hypothetical protein